VVNAGFGAEKVTVAVESVPFNAAVCVPTESVTEMVAGFAPDAWLV
jgi:hypothetical protein